MAPIDRRTALGYSVALGTSLSWPGAGQDPGQQDDAARDRKNVLAAGLTEAEADCWARVADAAGAFFGLPELHPMDRQEVATAIHVVQHKLLSRPTYRKYLQESKASDQRQATADVPQAMLLTGRGRR